MDCFTSRPLINGMSAMVQLCHNYRTFPLWWHHKNWPRSRGMWTCFHLYGNPSNQSIVSMFLRSLLVVQWWETSCKNKRYNRPSVLRQVILETPDRILIFYLNFAVVYIFFLKIRQPPLHLLSFPDIIYPPRPFRVLMHLNLPELKVRFAF